MDDEQPSQWRSFQRLRPNRKIFRRNARKLETAGLKHAHTFLIKRWDNARSVRRHAFAWLLLIGLLIGTTGLQMLYTARAYMTEAATDGGVYAEGVTGPLDTINPLFATSSAERAASRLIFAGLLGYDQTNQLRGDLAAGWQVQNEGKRYVVELRPGLTWQDGKPLTADDVIFTVARIKNPLTRSTLYGSWTEVTATKLDMHHVAFDLTVPFAPFPHALTFGLLPEHLLGSVPAGSLREAVFNRQPIGAGAFSFRRLQTIDPDQGRLVIYTDANTRYVHGKPRLEHFQLHVYKDHDQIRRAFFSNEINAATDLDSNDMAQISRERPRASQPHVDIYDGVYAFFNLDDPLFSDAKVRQALRSGLNRKTVLQKIGTASPLEGPLLNEHFDFVARKHQPAYDKKLAETLLDEAGWVRGADDMRTKADMPLRLSVVTPRVGDYPTVMSELAEQWRSLGVEVNTQLVDPGTVQQNVLLPRGYQVFIYELAIGADPDVYAYWHSSQADPRGLNLSNYKSLKADDALASAQTRPEMDLRAKKYESFFDQWLADVPAIALYQPTLHYVTNASTNSLGTVPAVVDPSARYYSVHLWTVERDQRYRTP